MAKQARQGPTLPVVRLEPCHTRCWECAGPLYAVYHKTRTVVTLHGVQRLDLKIRRCVNPACPRYHQFYRPEEEGAWALPHSEIGLDVRARVGTLRFARHRSVPEIHQELAECGVTVGPRTVLNLLHRYEELLAVHLADPEARRQRWRAQGHVVLALDGLQPDVGHEVLWVIREVLSGEVLLARSLLSGTEADLAVLLREVQTALPVPIRGVISDGQLSIRKAVQNALPGVPHQLCQFHYLREAALPIYEADRHAKKELKKHVRGIRPLERRLETRLASAPHAAETSAPTPQPPDADREQAVAEAVRGYCLAVRSALTDDGRPPLAASGLQLQARLTAIQASADRVLAEVRPEDREKGGRCGS